MLGIDRRVLSAAWTLFLFALLLILVYTIGHTLVLFTLALFLAHLLSPIVEFVHRMFPRGISRAVALALVYLALIGFIAAAGATLVPKIVEEASGLASRLPDAIQNDPLSHLPLPTWLEPLRDKVSQVIIARMQDLDKDILPMLSEVGRGVLSGVGNALSLILIPILSFFFLKDGLALRGAFVESFAPSLQVTVNEILVDLHELLANYIRALVLLSSATFLSHLAVLSAMGVPYAVLLAGVAAMLEFIPVVGPLSAAVIMLLVAAFSGYPHLLLLTGFLAVYRVFQDYVLSPFLMSSRVEVHPVVVLFGVVAGDQIAGIPGMFFSVPVIAALRLVFTSIRKRRLAD